MNKRYPFSRSWRWILVRLCDYALDLFREFNRKGSFPSRVQKVLVVRLDQIGDLMCALPVFPALRKCFPKAEITALVGEGGDAILKGNPYLNDVIVFSPNWFSRAHTDSARRQSFFDVVAELQERRFDIGYDLRGDLRNILLMALGGVRYRTAYGIAGGAGLVHDVPPYDETLHQAELDIHLIGGTRTKDRLVPELYLTEEERRSAAERLAPAGVRTGDTLIAIHPEAGYPSKEWGTDSFKKLMERLLAETGAKILIFGLGENADQLAQCFSRSGRVINFAGKLTLRGMIAMMSQCHLFIGNDSGPSHIASALGIPAVVIASGTNLYERWGIWREPSRILKHAVPCAPCHLPQCNVPGHPCMSEISPEQVFQAVEEMLAVAKTGFFG